MIALLFTTGALLATFRVISRPLAVAVATAVRIRASATAVVAGVKLVMNSLDLAGLVKLVDLLKDSRNTI